jgi:hypothetical protein
MRTWGNPSSQRRHSRGNDKRGDLLIKPAATPKDLRFRATWKLALRRARGRKFGATRRFDRRHHRKVRHPGELGRPPDGAGRFATGATWKRIVGDTEGPKEGATRRSASRHRRRMRDSRRLENPSPAKPEMRDEGQPETCIRSEARGREKAGRLAESQNQRR